MTAANKDDKLVSLRAEFGMWGIGAYWTLVELVAEQLSEKSDRAEATLIVQEVLGLFSTKRKQLICFLEASQNQNLLTFHLEGNILKINIPKLLEYADNYIKYDGKSLKSLQRQKGMSSKQEEKRSTTEEKKINTGEGTVYSFEEGTARTLYALILLNDPKAKQPDFEKWARDIDALKRIDGRTEDEILAVMYWCQQDQFWKSNILSARKLREKFSQLTVKMKNGQPTSKSGAITSANLERSLEIAERIGKERERRESAKA